MTVLFQHKQALSCEEYLKNLIFLAFSDGKLDELETVQIFRIGQKQGLSQAQVIELIGEGTNTMYLPERLNERLDFLFDLMQVLYSDGHANREEVELIHSIVSELGFDDDLVDKLVHIFHYHTPTTGEWMSFVASIRKEIPVIEGS